MDARIPIVLGVHAEKLHDDSVWKRARWAARLLAERGRRATFFVYPFRSEAAGEDIADRVRTIAALGHEIGQHTHFYSGPQTEGPGKRTDLSEPNVLHCLRRDFAALQRMGQTPRGFTAGAWHVSEAARSGLVDLGFLYDCSARFPRPQPSPPRPTHLWARSPELQLRPAGRLLSMPTTSSLREWFRWGRKIHADGAVPYQLLYVHDYDLCSPANRFLVLCLACIPTGRPSVAAFALAAGILEGRRE